MILTGLLAIVVAHSLGSIVLIDASETCSYYAHISYGLVLNVSEGTPSGTVVFQFSQTVSGGSIGPFTIAQNAVIVSGSTIVQRGQQVEHHLSVTCSDATATGVTILVTINIVNLYSALAPVWSPSGTNGVVYITIPEFSAVNSRVYNAFATDMNYLSSFVYCTCQFSPPILSQYFGVGLKNDSATCLAAITVTQMFDYEVLQMGNIVLTAQIVAPNQTVIVASTLSINITIQDLPNRAPIFLGSPYYANATTVGAQTIFANVFAQDGNLGLNGPVTISVVACSINPSPFSTVVSQGNLYAISQLSWGTVYYLVVQASLNSAPWLSNYTWVQITVAPAPTTTSTTTVSTTTGTTPPMTLIPCSATGSTQTVTTSVPVIGNLKPVFSSSPALDVMANAPVGFQVANLANLLNTNNNCSFATLNVLSGGTVSANYSLSYLVGTADFSVNATSGALTVANPLNYLANPTYLMIASVVLATQNATLGSASTTLSISVLMADENNPTIDLSTANVSVSYSAIGSTTQQIGQLVVTDPNVNGSLTYASFDYTGTFSVTSDGNIWLVNPSNVQPDTLYRFLVTVSDNWWPQPRVAGVSASIYVGPMQNSTQVQLGSLGWIVFGAIGGALFIILLTFTILAIKQKHPVSWTADNARSDQRSYENALANFAAPPPPPSQLLAPPIMSPPSHVGSQNNLASPAGSVNTSQERLMKNLSPAIRPTVTRASVQFTEETSDLESPYEHVNNRQPPTVPSESGVGLQYLTIESARSARNGSVRSVVPNGSASGTINPAFSKTFED